MKKKIFTIGSIALYALFLIVSFLTDYEEGIKSGKSFLDFAKVLLALLPPVFILIGLFEVWVSRETVEAQLGESSGIKGYLWMILLAGVSIGGLYTALPVGASLFRKGAGLKYVFTYLGAAAVCRVPMTLFEASYVGIKFSVIRLAVSLPLIVITAILLGRYLDKKKYKIENT